MAVSIRHPWGKYNGKEHTSRTYCTDSLNIETKMPNGMCYTTLGAVHSDHKLIKIKIQKLAYHKFGNLCCKDILIVTKIDAH